MHSLIGAAMHFGVGHLIADKATFGEHYRAVRWLACHRAHRAIRAKWFGPANQQRIYQGRNH